MSPELGFVLFVTLLWGPTALWLAFRTIRGHRGSPQEPFAGLSEPLRSSPLAIAEPEALAGLDGSWFCGACSSLNRRGANRCYHCRTKKGSTDRPTPSDVPVGPGVPVMAVGAARSSSEVPVGPGVPVMARGAARSSSDVVEAVVVPVTPGSDRPASETPRPTAESVVPALSPSVPVSPAICPFLGFRDDPSTRYDFPDPRNLCHASAERGTSSVSSRRPSVIKLAGTRKPQPIGVEHQESRCLTAAHEQCARYPAREAIAAN
ncbi:MAG: hypothetical protein MUE92_05920 [Chloroflexi bacterium]|jgi:hypothetical protein|nr:hypothetical protein [Chloroflexota bacterium]